MITLLIIAALFAVAVFIFMQQPQFGKAPSGERLERIQKSPYYKNGAFDNVSFTPQLAEDASMT